MRRTKPGLRLHRAFRSIRVLAISLSVGLLRDFLGEELREWFASLCAWLLLAASIWAAVNLIALYGTTLVLRAGPWARAALGSGWLLTVASSIAFCAVTMASSNRPASA